MCEGFMKVEFLTEAIDIQARQKASPNFHFQKHLKESEIVYAWYFLEF